MIQKSIELSEIKAKETVVVLPNTPETNEQSIYVPPRQSANVLFKFMPKLDYLKGIIKDKAIMPRYYEEKIDYLDIKGFDKIAFPMSCFCDIHLNKLVPHMRNYGWYGIGLSKEWGIRQGIQPIHYINKDSKLKKDFSKVFNNTMKIEQAEEREKFKEYNDYLLSDLLFMKPIEGEMMVNNNDEYEYRNFHDEKEWRFVPQFAGVDTELPLVIPQNQMNHHSYMLHSAGIQQRSELWLKFDLDAIKYIIVANQNDRKELIEFIIENQIVENDYDRYGLFSKILVFNELREDW